MEAAYTKSKNIKFSKEQWMTDEWSKIKGTKFDKMTGVDKEDLLKIGKGLSVLPADGVFHP